MGNDLSIVARDGNEFVGRSDRCHHRARCHRSRSTPQPANTGTTAVTARLAATGNGIELVDASTVTTGDLIVRASKGAKPPNASASCPTGKP